MVYSKTTDSGVSRNFTFLNLDEVELIWHGRLSSWPSFHEIWWWWRQGCIGCWPILYNEHCSHAHRQMELEVAVYEPCPCICVIQNKL
jgi:hypothetical protein